ncbi:hypothetical protein GCM10010420_31820 [Streptomyces glaucosporus]|uniref:Uncharacterized protein n=1 Tax=Streptomyces glaucosporus TaxID=284044 RepID=A0ABP5VJQ2_9ACTN
MPEHIEIGFTPSRAGWKHGTAMCGFPAPAAFGCCLSTGRAAGLGVPGGGASDSDGGQDT